MSRWIHTCTCTYWDAPPLASDMDPLLKKRGGGAFTYGRIYIWYYIYLRYYILYISTSSTSVYSHCASLSENCSHQYKCSGFLPRLICQNIFKILSTSLPCLVSSNGFRKHMVKYACQLKVYILAFVAKFRTKVSLSPHRSHGSMQRTEAHGSMKSVNPCLVQIAILTACIVVIAMLQPVCNPPVICTSQVVSIPAVLMLSDRMMIRKLL